MSASIKTIYIDTCVISQENKDFWRLLAAAKEKKLNIYISEIVIWERTKARDGLEKKSLFDSGGDKGIPRQAAYFKKTLKKFGVEVIDHSDEIIEVAEQFIQNDAANFNKNNYNELRDAHILAAAHCRLEKSTIIASNDSGLVERVPLLLAAFDVITENEITNFVESEGSTPPASNPCYSQSLTEEEIKAPFSKSLLSVLPIIDPESFKKYENDLKKINIHENNTTKIGSAPENIPTDFEKLESKIAEMHSEDTEIKKRVLGYTEWFSSPPISKDDLYKLLESKNYNKGIIENNAQRLEQESLLIETDHHWLINTQNPEAKEICEQAMAVVMPEILEMMELN